MDSKSLRSEEAAKPKRIRKGARDVPKVKSGCRTCKIRHKKCDETKPSCKECTRTGRTCDFLALQSSPRSPISGPPRYLHAIARPTKRPSSLPLSSSIPHDSSKFPLPILPKPLPALNTFAFTGDEVEHFAYFHLICTQEFSRYYEFALWKKLILQAASTEPSIRHAVVSLGALGRSLMDPLCQLSRDRSHQVAEYSARKYNLAMRELSDRLLESSTTAASWQLAIIGSLAFITIEVLQGHENSAYMHLRSAFAIMKSLTAGSSASSSPSVIPNSSETSTGISSSNSPNTALLKFEHQDHPPPPSLPPNILISSDFDDLLTIFSRYDVQTSSFMGQHPQSSSPTSSTMQALPVPSLPASFDTFLSARDSLNGLTTAIYFLRHRHSSPTLKNLLYIPLPSVIATKLSTIQASLSLYGTLLDTFCTQHPTSDIKLTAAINNLRLRYLLATIMLNTHFNRDQTAFDIYLPEFTHIVTLAASILSSEKNPHLVVDQRTALFGRMMAPPDECAAGSDPLLVLDVWMVQPLYYVVLKCRAGWLRRRALELMRTVRRGCSGSVKVMAGVAEWVIGIEEQGIDHDDDSNFIKEENRLIEVRLDFERVGVSCGMYAMRRRADGSLEEIVGEVAW